MNACEINNYNMRILNLRKVAQGHLYRYIKTSDVNYLRLANECLEKAISLEKEMNNRCILED